MRQRLIDKGQLFALVQIQGLLEQGLLVAEGAVQTGAGDAHGLGQLGERGRFVAAAPEYLQGGGQGLLKVEFARATDHRASGGFHTD